jgi:hypothetical protein
MRKGLTLVTTATEARRRKNVILKITMWWGGVDDHHNKLLEGKGELRIMERDGGGEGRMALKKIMFTGGSMLCYMHFTVNIWIGI